MVTRLGISRKQCATVAPRDYELMSEMQSSGGTTVSLEPVDIADDGGDGRTNALASAASAYLRSAMHQPVEWMEWGERAFERAAREDKPILLDIGAV